ncbi:MAG: hypothetical protein ACFFD2_28510 [Promethearchaeota archaeon]
MHLTHRDPVPGAFAFQQSAHRSLELIEFAVPCFVIEEGLVKGQIFNKQRFYKMLTNSSNDI